MAKKTKTEKSVALFTKEQLLRSETFSKRRDILNAVLKEDEQYSVAAAETAVNKFMKGKVK